MSHHTPRRARALIALALVGGLGLAACGDDSESPAASGDALEEETTTTEAPAEEEAETIEVTGVEYAYEGLDAEVAAGTELTFTNGGKEAHELVVMKRAEGETRTIEELMQLPEAEIGTALEFQGVSLANPGEEGQVVDGDLVLEDAGEYIAVCMFPVGTTEVPDGPPTGEQTAPPHAAQGMVTEFTVS